MVFLKSTREQGDLKQIKPFYFFKIRKSSNWKYQSELSKENRYMKLKLAKRKGEESERETFSTKNYAQGEP